MKQKKAWSIEKRLAVACLLCNASIAPGVGTFLWGWKGIGTKQIGLTVVGLLLLILGKLAFAAGIILLLTAWIWGIISGMSMIRQSK